MKYISVSIPGHADASLEGFIQDCSITLGQEKERPAVVVCPGGGYVYLSPREAEPVAMAYAARGFHVFLLHYSVGWNAGGFVPLEEISWVIGYIRENAAQWNVHPEKIAVCGFSAGGHLALSSALLAEHKPNAMILGYPAASAPNQAGVDFMLKVLEGRREVTDSDAEKYDLVPKITRDAPPVFLVATSEDLLTSFGALPIAKAYSALGMQYELHIFQFGPHGCSLANEASADGSKEVADDALAQWHELSVKWLWRIFGKPELTDKTTGRMMAVVREMGLG